VRPDFTNRQIGSFRAMLPIAKGGFSTIWKARYVRGSSEKVVLKIMNPSAVKQNEHRGMFAREWKMVRGLDHPCLLEYLEYGTHEGLPYMAMEFFPGQTLRQLLREENPVVRENLVPLVEQLARAVGYLHDQGIVHRDLKPENILLNEEALDLRLIDFSIAQTRWQRMMDFGSKMHGTPTYMAPEQLRGRRSRPESDLYSLGVIVYEMVAGRPPFTGQTEQEVMRQHVRSEPRRLSNLAPGISSELDKLVMDLLAKDPARRPRRAGEVMRKLGSARSCV
jgi:eukaryotic-like serine/threonine-protein kinase